LTTRVDALAAGEQPQAASSPPAATEQPQQPRPRKRQPQQPQQPPRTPLAPADTAIPPFDTSKFVLGKLCPRGHDYYGTGQTLRRVFRHVCPACDVERTREQRKARREGAP
jgi:hypothetical protein